MRRLLPLALLALAGCAEQQTGQPDPLAKVKADLATVQNKADQAKAKLQALVAADLTAASARAAKSNDVIAKTCWDGLLKMKAQADAEFSSGPTKVAGLADGFQALRDVTHGGGSGGGDVITDLRLYCGPLYIEERDRAVMFAGKAVVPGLDALPSNLPAAVGDLLKLIR